MYRVMSCLECHHRFSGFHWAKKNGAPTKRTVKAVEHTTKCQVKADQSSSAKASAVHS
jgi:hypothetical protein